MVKLMSPIKLDMRSYCLFYAFTFSIQITQTNCARNSALKISNLKPVFPNIFMHTKYVPNMVKK